MNFSKTRYSKFAEYDLAINKKFYRNFAIGTIAGAVGIAVIGFIARLLQWSNAIHEFQMITGKEFTGTIPTDLEFNEYWYPLSSLRSGGLHHYNTMYGTTGLILGFLIIMSAVFMGCWAHNMRSKQGRVNELTIPASNCEKFIWHTSLMFFGGIAVSTVAVLAADAVNALLTWLAVNPLNDGISSITVYVFRYLTWDFFPNMAKSIPTSVYIAGLICLFSYLIMQSSFYMLGNAIKYKYNIILTYITIQLASIIIIILIFVIFSILRDMQIDWPRIDDEETAIIYACSTLYGLSAIAWLITTLCIRKSYKLFRTAQITSRLNK